MVLSDEEVHKMAKARVEFKQHAVVYVIINLLLVGIWYLASGPSGYYWPVWTHLGWGIGLAFHAYGAYGGTESAMVAKEEEKIRRKSG